MNGVHKEANSRKWSIVDIAVVSDPEVFNFAGCYFLYRLGLELDLPEISPGRRNPTWDRSDYVSRSVLRSATFGMDDVNLAV